MHLNLLFSDYSGTGFISGWLSGLSMALVEYPHLPFTTEQMEMFSGRHSYICNTYRGKHLSSYCCCQQCCLSASGWTRLIFLWAVSERSIGGKLPKSCKNAIVASGRKSSNAVNTLLKLLFLSLSVEILTKCLKKNILWNVLTTFSKRVWLINTMGFFLLEQPFIPAGVFWVNKIKVWKTSGSKNTNRFRKERA